MTLVPDMSAYLAGGLVQSVALLLLLAGVMAIAWPMLAGPGARSAGKRRLKIEDTEPGPGSERAQPARRGVNAVREKAAKQAHEFYAKTDPENVARLRLKLIQAGYMGPRAVGTFFLVRFVALAAAAIAAFVLVGVAGADSPFSNRWVFIGICGGLAYFLPGLALSRKVSTKMTEYRNGFPDFMDLMIVCSDAGLSMEASIDRVSKELEMTYPSLAENLRLMTIEMRAGRDLDGALKSLADRLSLDEVRSFATLLQQSRELGTSLSATLRVFSDEMRHKRMSRAEEKAHALPAKMSVPVTVCILPVVLMIAIIPIIVKMTTQ